MTVSVLPPNKTAVERAIDQASAEALENIPVYLIRWVKNPDLCPLPLLPWLAWEYQVDTWNIDWSEQKKRDAIKRAHYIHCHRGTPAAVRRALVDSPFGTEIVEWFDQKPKGDPYTFRLNVQQDDRPVTIYDHQDLKQAVLRAKNLRSWFSVHVFGRLTGVSYAAGYMFGSERIRPRIVPTSIILSETIINLAPGESRTISVIILPPNAGDKTFTVTSAGESIASVLIGDGQFTVTGSKRGSRNYTVTTANGISATLRVNVVSVTQFVLRVRDLNAPLFSVAFINQDFTIDYGDGVDSRDYTQSVAANPTLIYADRDLVVGQDYTITVKNSDYINFTGGTNQLIELIKVASDRSTMQRFAYSERQLVRIHSGALDLPNATSFSYAFALTNNLTSVPAGLFSGCGKVTVASYIFQASGIESIPERFFENCRNVMNFDYAFSGCNNLANISGDVFSDSVNATGFSAVFHSCYALEFIPAGLFSAAVKAVNFEAIFYACKNLREIPEDLFATNTKIININSAFYSCESVRHIPGGLFRNNPLITGAVYTFYNTGIRTISEGLFDNQALITSFYETFSRCLYLESIPEDLFKNNVAATSFRGTFMSCPAVTEIPAGIFRHNINATYFYRTFYGGGYTEIPSDVFKYNVNATYISGVFEWSKIESVPEDLLKYNVKCTNVSGLFMTTPNLTSVPDGLLYDLPLLTDVSALFRGSALTSISGKFFSRNPLLSNFGQLFYSTQNIKTVPAGLFSKNINASSFNNAFGQSNFEEIPEGLFANNVNVNSFSECFSGCKQLKTVPANVLPVSTARSVSCSEMFRDCSTLYDVAAGFFTPLSASVSLQLNWCFTNSQRLASDINEIFNLESYNNVSTIKEAFKNCSSLTGNASNFLNKLPSSTVLDDAFAYCVRLSDYSTLPVIAR